MSAAYDLLVTPEDVVAYLEFRGIRSRLAGSADDVGVTEVTAGNMNRVFIARGPLGSVAVKQAPPWVQVVGPEWPVDPARIGSEARAYELLAGLVPEAVPAIDAVDLDRFILVMEDLSDLDVLRDVLVDQVADVLAGRQPVPIDFRALGEVVGRFSAELSLATSRVGLSADAHALLVEQAANPELCAMTDAVVLDEPYRDDPHNHWLPELDREVAALRSEPMVLEAVSRIREVFRSRAEALIHGDLHSGSIMVGIRDGAQATKVFDPEFGFVGPIGMDLGLFWANLVLASIAARAAGAQDLADHRLEAVTASWGEFSRILRDRWNSDGIERLGGLPGTVDGWLARIEEDAWGFAGVESIRRVVGFSHAADLTTLPRQASVSAHLELLGRARGWVLDRSDPLTRELP